MDSLLELQDLSLHNAFYVFSGIPSDQGHLFSKCILANSFTKSTANLPRLCLRLRKCCPRTWGDISSEGISILNILHVASKRASALQRPCPCVIQPKCECQAVMGRVGNSELNSNQTRVLTRQVEFAIITYLHF